MAARVFSLASIAKGYPTPEKERHTTCAVEPDEMCRSCPHPKHHGECPCHVIDLTHAPVDRLCWCAVRADDDEREPVPPTSPVSR